MSKLTDRQREALLQAASVGTAELREYRAVTISKLVTLGMITSDAEYSFTITSAGAEWVRENAPGEPIAECHLDQESTPLADFGRDFPNVERVLTDVDVTSVTDPAPVTLTATQKLARLQQSPAAPCCSLRSRGVDCGCADAASDRLTGFEQEDDEFSKGHMPSCPQAAAFEVIEQDVTWHQHHVRGLGTGHLYRVLGSDTGGVWLENLSLIGEQRGQVSHSTLRSGYTAICPHGYAMLAYVCPVCNPDEVDVTNLTDAAPKTLRVATGAACCSLRSRGVDCGCADAAADRLTGFEPEDDYIPEFGTGDLLRNPATGAMFRVVEWTHAVILRNVVTNVRSAVPADMARELDRIDPDVQSGALLDAEFTTCEHGDYPDDCDECGTVHVSGDVATALVDLVNDAKNERSNAPVGIRCSTGHLYRVLGSICGRWTLPGHTMCGEHERAAAGLPSAGIDVIPTYLYRVPTGERYQVHGAVTGLSVDYPTIPGTNGVYLQGENDVRPQAVFEPALSTCFTARLARVALVERDRTGELYQVHGPSTDEFGNRRMWLTALHTGEVCSPKLRNFTRRFSATCADGYVLGNHCPLYHAPDRGEPTTYVGDVDTAYQLAVQERVRRAVSASIARMSERKAFWQELWTRAGGEGKLTQGQLHTLRLLDHERDLKPLADDHPNAGYHGTTM